MTKLEELKVKRAAIKAEMVSESKAVFDAATKEIFAKYKPLKQFSWTQYTPYFCDGDACVFSANTDDPDINWDGVDIEAYSDQLEEDPVVAQCYKEIVDTLKQLDDEALEEMFGDHVKVIAGRKSVKVEEYEHD